MSEIRSTFDTTILEFNGKYPGFVATKKEKKAMLNGWALAGDPQFHSFSNNILT